MKAVFLLALATGKRRSELHALTQDVKWIRGDTTAMELTPHPDFVGKTHVATKALGTFKAKWLNL